MDASHVHEEQQQQQQLAGQPTASGLSQQHVRGKRQSAAPAGKHAAAAASIESLSLEALQEIFMHLRGQECDQQDYVR
jgi:hypothetical protein